MSKEDPPGEAPPYARPLLAVVLKRVREPRRFLQVLAGPRQTGKTTLALQVIRSSGLAAHYSSADDPGLRDRAWIETQWEVARELARDHRQVGSLLVLDEVQKLPGWSEGVKRLWDEDTASGLNLRVLLLGSAPLPVQRGLSESLTGRFEIIPVPHWSYPEMAAAFQFDLDQYLFFGGYPGAAPLIEDPSRWTRYIMDSLVETTISRDILLLSRVDKPALLRQLFQLACDYSGQILSYQKMLGQLQDAGNTTTLAHYLELLRNAGMVAGLPKFSGSKARSRGSTPKLLVLNTGIMSAASGRDLEGARRDHEFWGRLTESAVGAHLVNTSLGSAREVSYWRERNHEVDFVLREGRRWLGIEVKTGRRRAGLPGLERFQETYPGSRLLLVGSHGQSLERFLSTSPGLPDPGPTPADGPTPRSRLGPG